MIRLGVQSPLMEPAAGDSNSETQKVLTGDLKGVLFTAEQLVQTLKEAVLESKIKKLRGSSEHAFFSITSPFGQAGNTYPFFHINLLWKEKAKTIKNKTKQKLLTMLPMVV